MTAILQETPNTPRTKIWRAVVPLGFYLLSGCSTFGHKNDPSDIWYTPREALTSSEHYYEKSIAQGVVVGAVGGAALGALTAAIAGQNVGTGAAIGAGAGAVAGGVGGYFLAKQKVAADAATLASSVQNDILRENGEIDKVSVAFAHLRDCRFAAAERVRAEYQAQRLTREQAQKKLDDLKAKFVEDISIAEALGTKMGENMKEFQSASEQLQAQNPEAQIVLAEEARVAAEPPPTPAKRSAKGKKGSAVAAAPANTKKTKKPSTSQQPSTAVAAAKAKPAVAATVQVAKLTESSQVKQKAFQSDISNAKAQANKMFTLEKPQGQVLWAPEILYCGL
ncbi:MAG: hypothetical protein ACKN9T_02785 [Candidatus Methylumidiphilus sp.]